MYTSQIHEGEDYDKLSKCIHIGILNFELFPENEEYYSCFHFWEDGRHIKYTDKMELHIIELRKLEKYKFPETELLRWMKFMNAEHKEEFEMLAKENEYIESAYERLTRISADEKKRLEYEAREKVIRDHNYLVKHHTQKGFQQGMKRGIEQGREQGIRVLISTLIELGISMDNCRSIVKEKYKLNEKETVEYFEKYWK